jgi:hypothetical protein
MAKNMAFLPFAAFFCGFQFDTKDLFDVQGEHFLNGEFVNIATLLIEITKIATPFLKLLK